MLDEVKLRAEVVGGLWTDVQIVASTGSTNADLLARASADPTAPEGQVLVAEEQTAGRGRLGRGWVSAPGESLTFSVLLRPATVPPERRSWLPLLAGVAVASAVRTVTADSGSAESGGGGVEAVLKWPNDVLVGDRKLVGILAEQAPDGAAVVVGIGINVAIPAADLPVSPTGLPATSLLAEGATVSREALLAEVLRQFERWYAAFRSDPDPVRAELPAGREAVGAATDIDSDGRLLIAGESGTPPMAISAGDVIHVR
jgi:BirA family biotin operon repressor/biotin-[acetyl-CoA-carboxylase] ligase